MLSMARCGHGLVESPNIDALRQVPHVRLRRHLRVRERHVFDAFKVLGRGVTPTSHCLVVVQIVSNSPSIVSTYFCEVMGITTSFVLKGLDAAL